MFAPTWELLLAIILLMSFSVSAQRLDAIGKADPLKITGGLSTNQIAYLGGRGGYTRAPYTLFVSGSLNLNIYGWAVPLGFSISNQSKGRFQQPFNQYSLHPSYKWVTAHVGYTSMSFSTYTLNSHLFSGAGVDLAPPGAFKFSVMYGRLQKAVVADTLIHGKNIQPGYQRMGYGIKASYGKEKNNADLVIFKAKDHISSNPTLDPALFITPQSNVAAGINVTKSLFRKLILTGELGVSVLTRNQQASRDSGYSSPLRNIDFLLRTNNSTALYTAYKTGLTYGAKRYTIGLGYERISPEYKTLGAYYFANDFENITASLATKLLKDKLAVSLSTGMQHDDLRKDKQSTASRIVGSVNTSYQASKKLNLNATYSNFQSFVNIRSSFNQINELTPYDNLDTLNYTQIAKNLNCSASLVLSQSKEKTKMLNTNLSFMTSADKQGGVTQNSGGDFYNLNTSYSVNFIPKNFSLTSSINLSTNKVGGVQMTTLGPTLGANKSFFDKKLRSGVSTSWNGNFAGSKQNSSIINMRVNNTYTVKKQHNMSLSMVALSKGKGNAGAAGSKSFSEFTATFGYNYSFK